MLEKQIPERRLVKRMVGYWEALKGDQHMPEFGKFNASSLGDIWDYCFLVAVHREKDKKIYLYEHVGGEVINAYGTNPKGEPLVSGIRNSVPGADVVQQMDNCVDTMFPVLQYGKFINKKDKVIKYRSCILPFGSKGVATHAVVGLSWQKLS